MGRGSYGVLGSTFFFGRWTEFGVVLAAGRAGGQYGRMVGVVGGEEGEASPLQLWAWATLPQDVCVVDWQQWDGSRATGEGAGHLWRLGPVAAAGRVCPFN